jgi:hypothetical protein
VYFPEWRDSESSHKAGEGQLSLAVEITEINTDDNLFRVGSLGSRDNNSDYGYRFQSQRHLQRYLVSILDIKYAIVHYFLLSQHISSVEK